MPFYMIRDDITCVNAKAIVNAANSGLMMGGGVCGSIFRAAGPEKLQKACDEIGHCDPGQAVITPGFNLPKAEWVIHTVGPVWHGGRDHEAELLASCYRNSLRLAEEKEIPSIAFPLISAGIYGYPREEALRIASDTIKTYLMEESTSDLCVYLVLFDRRTVDIAENKLYQHIVNHLDEDAPALLFARRELRTRRPDMNLPWPCDSFESADVWGEESVGEPPIESCAFAETNSAPAAPKAQHKSLNEKMASWLGSHIFKETSKEKTFTETLWAMVDERGLTDVQVYKKANIDRRLFSKIRSKHGYQPSKETVFALCLALELNREEADRLLASAGLAFAPSGQVDQLVVYCLKHGYYDIYDVNEVLFNMDIKGLGSA